jgi:hypothetical protein
MGRQRVGLVKAAALVAAFLLMAPRLLAGGGQPVRAGDHSGVRPQAAPAPVRSVAAPVTVSLTLAAPAEPAYVNLRGPDGQLRRFAVEGGPEAVSTRVIVLRPGDSLTIQLAAKK